MLVTVFVNAKDKSVEVLGKALVSLLDRKYFVFTRMQSEYPYCPVEDTMTKLREIAKHNPDQERLIISFGCRVLPNNIKEVENLAAKNKGNIVFLKKLRGSKTWRELDDGTLTYDNERIADCGIFIINREDLLNSHHSNFNTFIRSLLTAKQLAAVYVDFWLFANTENFKGRNK